MPDDMASGTTALCGEMRMGGRAGRRKPWRGYLSRHGGVLSPGCKVAGLQRGGEAISG